MLDGRCEMLLAEEEACEEVDKGFLDPGLAENDKKDEDEQMDVSHNQECLRHAHEIGEPKGEGE